MIELKKRKVHLFEGDPRSKKDLYLARLLHSSDFSALFATCNRTASNLIQRLIELGLSAEEIHRRFRFIDAVSKQIGVKPEAAVDSVEYCEIGLNDLSLSISIGLDKLAAQKRDVVLVLDNLSTLYAFHREAAKQFAHMLSGRARERGAALVYLLELGAQEEEFERFIEGLADVIVRFELEADRLVALYDSEKDQVPLNQLSPPQHLPKVACSTPPEFFIGESLGIRESRSGLGREINLFWTQLVNLASLLIDHNLPLHLYAFAKECSRGWHSSKMTKSGILGKGWKAAGGFDIDAVSQYVTGKGAQLLGESILKFNPEKSSKDQLFFLESQCLDCWQIANINSMICYTASGIAAGGVEAFTGRQVESIETACKANGAAYCEFTIGDMAQSDLIEHYNLHVRRVRVKDALDALSRIIDAYHREGRLPEEREQLGPNHDFIGLQLRTSLPCASDETCAANLFEGAKIVSQRIYSHLTDIGEQSPIEVMLGFVDKSKVGKISHNSDLKKIIVEGNAEGFGLNTGKPSCQFMRGYLTGMMEASLNKSIEYIEKRCLAAKDEICEFERI